MDIKGVSQERVNNALGILNKKSKDELVNLNKLTESLLEVYGDSNILDIPQNQLAIIRNELAEITNEEDLLLMFYILLHRNKEKYRIIPSDALYSVLKRFFNNPTQMENTNIINFDKQEVQTTITLTDGDDKYVINIGEIKELFTRRIQNGGRVFNFLLIKMNEQNFQERTYFKLSELIDAGIYSSKPSAYKGLKSIISKFRKIEIEGNIKISGKVTKEVLSAEASLVTERFLSYNECFVSFASIIRQCARHFVILPNTTFKIENDSAFILIDYLYYMASVKSDLIENQGYYTITFEEIREHIGLHTVEQVKKDFDYKYSEKIINPLNIVIEAIKKIQLDININCVYKYKDTSNIYDYLNNYLEISLANLHLQKLMTQNVFFENLISETKFNFGNKKLLPDKSQ